ncbi:hypothetical protein GCM10010340_27660 [Streptomyces griseoloalbus]|nr:hypothetical protein GCM10010340_27660 [Streptomyces albaduncus]
MDADPQTGMLVALLPVAHHVRLVHSAPLDFGPLFPICGLSALSNEQNALWSGGSPHLISDQALRWRNSPTGRPAHGDGVPHITSGAVITGGPGERSATAGWGGRRPPPHRRAFH